MSSDNAQLAIRKPIHDRINEVAEYLEPDEQKRLHLACEKADAPTIQSEIRRFFSTWKTSLMSHDIQKLERLSLDPELSGYVETIWIEDDCERNDPWNTPTPLHFPNIWPRDSSGNLVSAQLGIGNLKCMLADKSLCPATIKIRDYRISRCNFALCPETDLVCDYRIEADTASNPMPAAMLARDIVDAIDVAIVSISIRYADFPHSENSILRNSSGSQHQGAVLCSPSIVEVSMDLSPQHQGQGVGLSLLRSAELQGVPYWLERVLGHAPMLEDLRLSLSSTTEWDVIVSTCRPTFRLKRLDLRDCRSSVQTLMTLLAHSGDSLECFSSVRTMFTGASMWHQFLTFLGNRFSKLDSFRLVGFLEEVAGSKRSVGFSGFEEDDVVDRYGPELVLKKTGPPAERRITRVILKGQDARIVLQKLASYAV